MDPYIGEIRLFAGSYAPVGWVMCNGQVLQIVQNQALYSVIGTVFGGDGKNTFNVPDMRGLAPMHQGSGDGLTPRTFAETGGSTTITLSETQMPVHDHAANCQTTPDKLSPLGTIWAAAGGTGRTGFSFYTTKSDLSMNPAAISAVGSDQPHNNVQPYIGLNFIIATEGIFPAKP